MILKCNLRTAVLVVALGILGSAGKTYAATVLFTIDPMSALTLNASLNNTGLLEQGPGSKTSFYSGSISVDVDNVLAPTSIQFNSANAIASVTGQWLPEAGGGPAAGSPGVPQDANYGLFLPAGVVGNAYAAARDVRFNVTSGPLAVAAGQFPSTQTLTYLSGFFDVNAPAVFGAPPSRDDLTGDTRTNIAAALSSYSVVGNTATLIVNYEDLNAGSFATAITGRLIATATVPEPNSMTVVLFGFLAGLRGIRRR